MSSSNLKNAKELLKNTQSILIITGAGMSVDSGIPTYRKEDGLWTKSIQIGTQSYSYDEISSLKMWKEFPELAWGFKSNFFQIIQNKNPHDGYYNLLKSLKEKYDYFICTSNIDGYFKRSGFPTQNIYEVHGNINFLQCSDKKCNQRNGITRMESSPSFDPETLIARDLPKCQHCKKMLRPNVSMFGDHEFYQTPYTHQKNRLNAWLQKIQKEKKTLLIIEIGCGINPHSLRMSNGVMMSGEWKMPKISSHIGSIRINPNDEQKDSNTIHLHYKAIDGIRALFHSSF